MKSIKSFLCRRPHALPALIAAAMLFAAMGKWPYDYYKILRWVVCVVAVFIACKGWAFRKTWVSWLFGIMAVLFNPLVPVNFGRETWQVIDLVAGVGFIAITVALARPLSSVRVEDPNK